MSHLLINLSQPKPNLNRFLKYCFNIYLIVSFYSGYAQPYYCKHFEIKDGLSNNTAMCLLQDSKGFVWIGTKDMVNRYDGTKFKTFALEPFLTSSIRHLYEDAKKILWVGTENGLYAYNENKETFNLVKETVNTNIFSITEDLHDNNILFIADFSLFKIKNNVVNKIDLKTPLTTLCSFDKHTVWIGNINSKLIKYNFIDNSAEQYDLTHNGIINNGIRVETIYKLNDSILLIGTAAHGVKAFNTLTNTSKDIFNDSPNGKNLYIRDFLKVSDKEIWIATENGIYILYPKTNNYINLVKNYNDPFSISDNAVYGLIKDKEGGIWASTYFGGVNYFPKPYNKFEKFFPKQRENSVSGNAVREIVKDNNGNLWIGTEDNGLNKFDPKTNKFTHHRSGKNGISSSNIHGLVVVDNELWIGTFDQGLDVMDLHSGKIIRHYQYGSGKHDLKSNFVHSLAKTKNKKIIVATTNAIFTYNKNNNNFDIIPHMPVDIFYASLLVDNTGKIWSGTFNNGLYTIDLEDKVVNRVRFPLNNKDDILIEKRITDIYQDSENNIWIATESCLYKYYPSKKVFKEYSTRNGLPANLIYSIKEDNNQVMWISTSKGLASLGLADNSIKIYNRNNDLLYEQFNYKSSFKDDNGDMYFGGIKGMIRFNPENFMVDTFNPPLYITGFQISNKEVGIGNEENAKLKKSIILTDNITLKHDESTFSIDFAALEFSSSENIQYAYMLEGLDKEWTYLDANRRVYYTNLPAGVYYFKVKSTNSNGIWSNNERRLQLNILPPFWKSNFAYLIYTLLVAGSLYLVYTFYREKNLQKMAILNIQREKELYQSKIDFFTQVAHEIRTPLTLIKGPLEKIMKKSNIPDDVGKYIVIMDRNTQRLLSLTNELLNFREIETNKFSLTFTKLNITDIVLSVIERYQDAIDQKDIMLKSNIPDKDIFAFADHEALTKIISNLLNNALKYGESLIVVSLGHSNEKNEVYISVSNDGKKIPAELKDRIFEPFFRTKNTKETGSGIGLTLARSLAELHNGSLNFINLRENLNTFELIIPDHINKEKES